MTEKIPNKDGKQSLEFTKCILVRVSDVKKVENGENKENEPVENGVANGHSEADSINTEIEIDAVSSIDNNDFEIQTVGTVETPKEIPKEPLKETPKETPKEVQKQTTEPVKVSPVFGKLTIRYSLYLQ